MHVYCGMFEILMKQRLGLKSTVYVNIIGQGWEKISVICPILRGNKQ